MKIKLILLLLLGWCEVSLAQFVYDHHFFKSISQSSSEFNPTCYFFDFNNDEFVDYYYHEARVLAVNPGRSDGFQLDLEVFNLPYIIGPPVDFNGDGYLDLLCKGYDNYLYLLRNEVGLNLTKHLIPNTFLVPNLWQIPLDLNQDGFPDLRSNSNTAFLNSGDGINFTSVSLTSNGAPYCIDIDNDGLKDLIRVQGAASPQWAKGLGGSSYGPLQNFLTLESYASSGFTYSELLDFDDDDDLDMVWYGNGLRLFLNQGDASLTSPGIELIPQVPDQLIYTFGRFNADDYFDAIARVGSNLTSYSSIIIPGNTGLTFDNAEVVFNYHVDDGFYSDAELIDGADMNGDGQDELYQIMDQVDEWIVQFRMPEFGQPLEPILLGTAEGTTAKFRNMNNDPYMDVLYSGTNWIGVSFGNESGDQSGMIVAVQIETGKSLYISDAGDFNDDGLVDIVVATGTPESDSLGLYIYPGLGADVWGSPIGFLIGSGINAIKVSNINGDSFDDVLLTMESGNDKLIIFEGEFTPQVLTLSSYGVAEDVADFDNNGWLDIVANGRIIYQMDSLQFSSYVNSDIDFQCFGDVNGDNLIDMVTQSLGPVRILFNNGYQNWQEGPALSAIPSVTNNFKLHDADADGDLDLFYSVDYGVSYALNDGNGNFSEQIAVEPGSSIFLQDALDYDGDGDTDLLFKSPWGYLSRMESSFFLTTNNSIQEYAITGVVYFDQNQNGVLDLDEQGINQIQVINQTTGDSYFTNSSGVFYLSPDLAGDFLVNVEASEDWIVTSTLDTLVQLSTEQPTAQSINFGLYPANTISNLEVSVNAEPAICNLNQEVWIDVQNLGATTPSLVMKYWNVGDIEVLSATPSWNYLLDDTLVWILDSLAIQQYLAFQIQVSYPPVSDEDQIFDYYLDVTATENMTNIQFADSLEQELLCSYDPNIIIEHTGQLSENFVSGEEFLEYTIHFQNTGNYFATDVRVENQLSDKLDFSTFDPITSSHDMGVSLSPEGLVIFNFDEIMLPDSSSNEEASHGFVTYRIKPISNLNQGDLIYNAAEIYFDLNPAIYTPEIYNTVMNCSTFIASFEDALQYCGGEEIQFSASILGAESYQWIVNEVVVSLDSNLTFSLDENAVVRFISSNELCVFEDSIEISILPASTTLVEIENCGEYQFGEELVTENTVITQFFQNSVGCDSLVEFHFEILPEYYQEYFLTGCNFAEWNDEFFDSSGIYEYGMSSSMGCDSILIFNVNIEFSSTTDIPVDTCSSSYLFEGDLYTESGQYIYFFDGENGCDSIVYLNLQLSELSNEVLVIGDTLLVAQNGAQYQWLDCLNDMSPIQNETSQNLVVELSGSYAVEISDADCTVISDCIQVTVDQIEEPAEASFVVYPNPTHKYLTLENLYGINDKIYFSDALGKNVLILNLPGYAILNTELDLASGVYFVYSSLSLSKPLRLLVQD